MKQIVVLALGLMVLGGWGATQAFGIPTFYIQPCTTYADTGTEFSVNINVKGNTDSIYAWQYYLSYKNTFLRLDSLLEGPWLSRNGQQSTFFTFAIDTNRVPNYNYVLAISTLLDNEPSCKDSAGTMARMVFHVQTQGACTLHFNPPFVFNSYLIEVVDTGLFEIDPILQDGYVFSPLVGVETSVGQGDGWKVRPLKATPNPFVSFATVSGYEGERFALYDISGKLVGSYRGNRIGQGLPPGVYFLKLEGREAKPLRLIKLH
jgi:hypothetical protein